MKCRNYTLVLYDLESVNRAIKNSDCIEYCFVCHDRDLDEKGEVLKPHYHLIMTFVNAISIDTIKERLNVPYIEPVKSLQYMLLYLVHSENPDKIMYAFQEVTGSVMLKMKLKRYMNTTSSSEKLELVIQAKGELQGNDFWNYLIQNNLTACYMKYKFIVDAYVISKDCE